MVNQLLGTECISLSFLANNITLSLLLYVEYPFCFRKGRGGGVGGWWCMFFTSMLANMYKQYLSGSTCFHDFAFVCTGSPLSSFVLL